MTTTTHSIIIRQAHMTLQMSKKITALFRMRDIVITYVKGVKKGTDVPLNEKGTRKIPKMKQKQSVF